MTEYIVEKTTWDDWYKHWYSICFPGFDLTDEIMIIKSNRNSITKPIFKAKPGFPKFTPSLCVRDCGNHYIIANYSSYTRIDKETMEITYNAEDI